jgi:hypothetical protein
MNRNLVMTLTLMVLMASFALSAPMARADSLTFTLAAPPTYNHTGDVLNFFGTISAPSTNGAALFLNGIDINIIPAGTFVRDDSPFFVNTPFSLNPGESTGNVLLFTETIGSPTIGGVYYALTASLLYGADGNGTLTQDSNSVQFAVPEPASMTMLGAGLLSLAGLIRRKR